MNQSAPQGAEQAAPLEVVVERGRVWIKRGVQSFMLAYDADTDEERQWYAGQLRVALGLSALRCPRCGAGWEVFANGSLGTIDQTCGFCETASAAALSSPSAGGELSDPVPSNPAGQPSNPASLSRESKGAAGQAMDVLRQCADALACAEAWSNGDKWRHSKDPVNREAWRMYRNMLQETLSSARSLLSSTAGAAQEDAT